MDQEVGIGPLPVKYRELLCKVEKLEILDFDFERQCAYASPPALKSLFAMQKVSPVSSLKSVEISSSPVVPSWFEKSQYGTRVFVVLLKSLTGT